MISNSYTKNARAKSFFNFSFKSIFLPALLLILLSCNAIFADVGQTMAQAEKSFGTPMGEIISNDEIIRIYQYGKESIREVYNKDGICISSTGHVKHAPELKPEPKIFILPIVEKTQLTKESEPPVNQVPKPIETIQPSRPTPEPEKNKGLILTLCILFACITISGLTFAFLKLKKSPSIPEEQPESETFSRIKKECDILERRSTKKPLNKSLFWKMTIANTIETPNSLKRRRLPIHKVIVPDFA